MSIRKWSTYLAVASLVGMFIAPYMALVYARLETQMLMAQKIVYFHVPSAWAMYTGFFLTFVFSVLYLWKKEKRWDIWASCSAEVGLLFCTVVLITGMIWAKPIWGAWWVWSPQLTLVLLMWLIFVAYRMLHSYSEDPLSSARFRAVLGIIGFLDAPLIHVSVKLWRGMHPSVIRAERVGMPPDMLTALLVCGLVFLLLFFAILFKRVSIERARDQLESVRAALWDRRIILGRPQP